MQLNAGNGGRIALLYDKAMNWRTAVCGFITLYCLAGLIYTLARSGDPGSLWFFGIGTLLFPIVGIVHERWVRRRKTSRPTEGG